jgi:hypothetical protein
MGKLFLVGFWAAAMSSLVVWNGVSLMFADFMGKVTGRDSSVTARNGMKNAPSTP